MLCFLLLLIIKDYHTYIPLSEPLKSSFLDNRGVHKLIYLVLNSLGIHECDYSGIIATVFADYFRPDNRWNITP